MCLRLGKQNKEKIKSNKANLLKLKLLKLTNSVGDFGIASFLKSEFIMRNTSNILKYNLMT